MKLSKRLASICALIEKYSDQCIIGDIGSDHAYLPCYLALNDITTYAYACDVAKLPLESAKKSIAQYRVEERVSPLLGDGIEPLKDKKVNAISISGMGAFLITDILSSNIDVAKNVDKLYLQANANVEHLRKYLYDNKFKIIDETILFEGQHFYEIIVAEYDENLNVNNDYDIYFGPILRKNKSDDFKSKWTKQLSVFQKLLKTLDSSNEKYNVIENKVNMIEEVLYES